MNRENRRHPKHPILPDLTTSKKRVLDDLRSKPKVNPKPKVSSKKGKII